MPEDGLPFLSSIGLAITSRCPIACAHCILNAGPHRKEEISIDEARDWMEQAAAYRQGHVQSVVITGGEPFYNLDLLLHALDCATSCRLLAIVMTNAFWASSLQAALDMLRSLPQIRVLGVSTDAYHQRFVPLQNVKNAILAARDLGIGCSVAVCFEAEDDTSFLDTKTELAKVIDERRILPAGILAAGRAMRFKPERFATVADCPVYACTGADSPTIFPDGSVIGCMGMVPPLPAGHPLLLGNVREKPLAEILDAAECNTALHILRVWGPKRLLQMLAEAGEQDRLPRRFAKHSCCDLCYALASEPSLNARLLELTADAALAERVSYARLFYMQEEPVTKA